MTADRTTWTVVLVAGVFLSASAGVAGAESKKELDAFCAGQLEQCRKDCEVAEEGTDIRQQCDSGCLRAWDECEAEANKSGPAGSTVGGGQLPTTKSLPDLQIIQQLTQPKVQPGGALQ
jgi:hypothetical protein